MDQEERKVLDTIWRNLKKHRKLNLGPLALAFRLERSIRVTGNALKPLHFTAAYQDWAKRKTVKVTPPEPGQQPDNIFEKAEEKPEVAVIVGVGPGFGYALARKLAKEGFAVILASRNANRLDGLVQEIQSTGGFAYAFGCDATSEKSVIDLFADISGTFGVPHLVIYSLQNFGPGSVIDIEVPAFEDGWKHNCLGAFLVARSAGRLMRPLGRGSIILVGSTSSVLGRAGHLNLAVGKFGQRALAQVLARELWPAGIHIAHLIIDADIREDNSKVEAGTSSDPDQIAESVLSLYRQPKTAWTSEMDIRPWNEQFWEHC